MSDIQSTSLAADDASTSVDPRSEVSAHIVADLLHLAHRLRGVLSGYFGEFGLSDVRFTVMQAVQATAPEGCSQSALAERLEQSESSVSTLVDRMRNAGLLYRLRSKDDRRKRTLMLTDEGRALLARIQESHGRRMAPLFAGLDETKLLALADMLKRLIDELTDWQTDDDAPPASIPHTSDAMPSRNDGDVTVPPPTVHPRVA